MVRSYSCHHEKDQKEEPVQGSTPKDEQDLEQARVTGLATTDVVGLSCLRRRKRALHFIQPRIKYYLQLRWRKPLSSMSTTPTNIALSAMLNAGQCHCCQ